MASPELRRRIEAALNDLGVLKASSRFRQASSAPGFTQEYARSTDIVDLKLLQAKPYLEAIDDIYINPIATFLEQIPRAIESPQPNQTQAQALIVARNRFIQELPLVVFGIIEASGLLEVSGDTIRQSFDDGQKRIDEQVKIAREDIDEVRTKLGA